MAMLEIRDWLYIGKFAHTRNRDYLEEKGIQAMLQLADHVPQLGISTLHLDVADGEALPHDKLKKGINFIQQQKTDGQRTLVACGAGISRSVVFAMAILMQEEKLSLFDAYREVRKRHPRAEPHYELVISLAAYHGHELDLMEAWEGIHDVQQALANDGYNTP